MAFNIINSRVVRNQIQHFVVKRIFLTISIATFLFSCDQSAYHTKFLTIDPSIKNKVDKYLTKYTDTLQPGKDSFFYSNRYMVEVYFNDTLFGSTYNKSNSDPFKSNYSWSNDTLKINGRFGLFETIGFEIKIYNDTLSVIATVKDNEGYKNNITDSISPFLQIPTTESKVILSDTPKNVKGQILYGYVEFKTANVFFQQANEKRRVRQNMKAYFKSEQQK